MVTAIFELIFIVALIKCCISIYDDIQKRRELKKASEKSTEKDAEKHNKWEDRFND